MLRLRSSTLRFALAFVPIACTGPRLPLGAPMEGFALLTIPPPGIGTCSREPYRGDFMEGDAAPGLQQVALDIGQSAESPGRTIRVILDSLGNPVSFRDEIAYLDSVTTVSVRFRPDRSIASGMVHRHSSGTVRATDGDSALLPERYSAVVQATRLLRERCAA